MRKRGETTELSKVQFYDHPVYPHTIMTALSNLLTIIRVRNHTWEDRMSRPEGTLDWSLRDLNVAYFEDIEGLPLGMWIEVIRHGKERNELHHFGALVVVNGDVPSFVQEEIDGTVYVIFKRLPKLEEVDYNDSELKFAFVRDDNWTRSPDWWKKQTEKVDFVPFVMTHSPEAESIGNWEWLTVTGDMNAFMKSLGTRVETLPEMYELHSDGREIVHGTVIRRILVIRGKSTGTYWRAELPDTHEVSWDDITEALRDVKVDFWRVQPYDTVGFERWEKKV